jgi:low temperature requirement protein LtrA
VLLGPLLFLIGCVLFRRVLEQRWARAQLAGIAALLVVGAVALASGGIGALWLTVAASVVLAGVAAGETLDRVRRGRRSGG